MSRVLLAWELGGNLGHIKPLLALAFNLRDRGHSVTFALRGVRNCGNLLSLHGFPFVFAPAVAPRVTGAPREPATYPELLLHAGFGDAAYLATAARAWRGLYAALQPDLIVFEHAPVALLAARGLGIPRAHFGTGFTLPPRVSPFPSFRPWTQVPADRLESAERRVLDAANTALRALATTPLGALCDLLDAEEDFLATLRGLDHYSDREGATYWGPVYDDGTGDVPVWPEGQGKQVFVYVRRRSPAFDDLHCQIRGAGFRTIWFAPDLSEADATRMSDPGLRFTTRPLHISRVAAAADIAIVHAGHGTVAAMLQHGVPMLLLPENLEQIIVARNVERLGAGAAVLAASPQAELQRTLRMLVGRGRLATGSNATSHEETMAAISSRMEELIQAGDARRCSPRSRDQGASAIATARPEVSALNTRTTTQ